MGILCKLGQHQPAPTVRANGGASFGRCRGCGCELILAASGWRPVPRGYRIVWRSEAPERAADPAQLPLALPEPPGPPPGARRISRPEAPEPRFGAPRTGRSLAPSDSTRITA